MSECSSYVRLSEMRAGETERFRKSVVGFGDDVNEVSYHIVLYNTLKVRIKGFVNIS